MPSGDWCRKQTGVRPPRVVTEQLANLTLNRIRRRGHPSAVWQMPRWRTRHKRTGAVQTIDPVHHERGIFGLLAPNTRLVLAHIYGDRLRLRATLAFLNARVDHQLSPSCYGGRPRATANRTDRRAALKQFRRLVWQDGHHWVAKLDVRQFFDMLPHGPMFEALRGCVDDHGCIREVEGYLAWYWRQCWPGHETVPPDPVGTPQGSPISGVLANVLLASLDRLLEVAGIPFIRYLDDVTVVAREHDTLLRHLATAMTGLERLGLTLEPAKTKVACLDPTPPRIGSVPLPITGGQARIDCECDLLGIHFFADGNFRARERTVNRLLSTIRRMSRPMNRDIDRDGWPTASSLQEGVNRCVRQPGRLRCSAGRSARASRRVGRPGGRPDEILADVADSAYAPRRFRVSARA